MLTVDWQHLSPIHAGGAAVLLVVLIQTTCLLFRRLYPPAMSVTVKWGHERLHVPLPDQNAKLGSLRSILAEQTGLAPHAFKLIHAGGVMKDDNAPVSAYGIGLKSVIALVGGAAIDAPPLPPSSSSQNVQSKPSTEEDLIAVIRDELASVQSRLIPALDTFLIAIDPPAFLPLNSIDSSSNLTDTRPLASVKAASPSTSSSPGGIQDLEIEHRRLGEELLQALLRLDVLTLDGGWNAARAERKNAIKLVQRHLNRLDDGWKERTERQKSLT